MTFEEALNLAKENLCKPGVRAFAVYTFSNEGKYDRVNSCGPLDLVLIKINAEKQVEEMLLPPPRLSAVPSMEEKKNG